MDGLILTVAYFIYALPAVLVVCVMSALFFTPLIAAGDASQETLDRILAGSSFVSFCLICLVSLYALVLTVLLPGILANFAQKRTFGSCFELAASTALTRHGSTSWPC
jgi:hypothetical protein